MHAYIQTYIHSHTQVFSRRCESIPGSYVSNGCLYKPDPMTKRSRAFTPNIQILTPPRILCRHTNPHTHKHTHKHTYKFQRQGSLREWKISFDKKTHCQYCPFFSNRNEYPQKTILRGGVQQSTTKDKCPTCISNTRRRERVNEFRVLTIEKWC